MRKRYSNLKKNQTVKEKNWNDTALNIITRKGNKVYVDSHYRYGPSKSTVMSYADYRKGRKDINYFTQLYNI